MTPDSDTPVQRQVRRVNDAVAAAARRTCANIIPVVSSSSARYEYAEDLVGWWAAALGLALAGLLVTQRHLTENARRSTPEWTLKLGTVLVVILCGWILGMLVAKHIRSLRRLFIPRKAMLAAGRKRAATVFQDCRLRAAAAGDVRPIVLIFVSLSERFVTVVASLELQKEVGPAAFEPAEALIARGLKKHRPYEAMCQAIAMIGELLSRNFPASIPNGEPSRAKMRVLD